MRAEELRTIAEGMFDQTAKKMLLETATDYLKMADSVEHMGDYKPPPFGKAKPKAAFK